MKYLGNDVMWFNTLLHKYVLWTLPPLETEGQEMRLCCALKSLFFCNNFDYLQFKYFGVQFHSVLH